MLRYRLLYGFMVAVALGLAQRAAPDEPIWSNLAFYGVLLAYFAGVIAQKYSSEWSVNDDKHKSFRLSKGVDKW